ncbi:MAG TPA: glycosyltransferase family A protein, partial [Rudaea sp.]|nr:glycosyltransferase family A protein [Rudaea sp.]
MSTAPRFSIVVPHYDGSIADASLLRGLNSLAAQSLRDFEVLLLHDGPLSRPLPDLAKLNLPGLRFRATAQRHNDWGHSLRDAGIHEAAGDYVVHFNPDNVLYPNALEVLDAAGRRPVP